MVYAVYGQPAPFSLAPCPSASGLSSVAQCAATATRTFANGTIVDVTHLITVQDASVNVTAK